MLWPKLSARGARSMVFDQNYRCPARVASFINGKLSNQYVAIRNIVGTELF
jgi:hypothetical protein